MNSVDFSKPVLLSVKHLQVYCDPFRSVCWNDLDKPISRLEVASAILGRMSKVDKARHDHAVKIAHFVKNYNESIVNNYDESDYICVDVGAPALGFYPSWLITDGNHRFAAALYRGSVSILAECSGQHSLIEKLLYKEKSDKDNSCVMVFE